MHCSKLLTRFFRSSDYRPDFFLWLARCTSDIQLPDCNVEDARKGNPCHERNKAPSCHPVEPIERNHSGENDQELRNDVDKAE